MKTIRKIAVLAGLLVLGYAGPARAEFTFTCGDLRDRGVEHAEISFVDSLESSMKLYLAGKEVPEEKLGFKALDKGQWIVSVDQGADKGSRKFLFTQGLKASVQESSVSEKAVEKKAGARKICRFKQKHAAPKN